METKNILKSSTKIKVFYFMNFEGCNLSFDIIEAQEEELKMKMKVQWCRHRTTGRRCS